MPKSNSIKCRFCEWRTNLWGRGSNPSKAFARLAFHIEESHDAEGGLLIEENLKAYIAAEEKIASYR